MDYLKMAGLAVVICSLIGCWTSRSGRFSQDRSSGFWLGWFHGALLFLPVVAYWPLSLAFSSREELFDVWLVGFFLYEIAICSRIVKIVEVPRAPGDKVVRLSGAEPASTNLAVRATPSA